MDTPRIYGRWAGNKKGYPEDPAKCIESVTDGFNSGQCTRKRGKGPDGLYCGQHNPDAIKAKKAAANAVERRRQERSEAYTLLVHHRLEVAEAAKIAVRNAEGMEALQKAVAILLEVEADYEKAKAEDVR